MMMQQVMTSDNLPIDPLDLFLGKKLKHYRTKVGWTLSDLSARLGVSHQLVHKYEYGFTKISANTLYKLSQLFHITPNSFYEGFYESDSANNLNNEEDSLSFKKKEKINILLIEDNPADEFLLRKILDSSQYKTNLFCLHDGQDVMNFLRKNLGMTLFQKPDLILLDLNLPHVNGISVLKSLKQDREFQNIPVIVITNSLSKKDMENCYKNFASGYMSKSFDFNTFKNNLLKAVGYWVDTVILPA